MLKHEKVKKLLPMWCVICTHVTSMVKLLLNK